MAARLGLNRKHVLFFQSDARWLWATRLELRKLRPLAIHSLVHSLTIDDARFRQI